MGLARCSRAAWDQAAWGRAFTLLVAATGLAACVADPNAGGYNRPISLNGAYGGSRAAPAGDVPGHRVSILLPLTGSNADVGQAMLRAAQLALSQPGSPPLDARDTAGTPSGAADAARAALAGGAGIILGPLTAAETGAVAPIAVAAGVPVLAFTSDATKAQPGVWTLGITPGQQMRRLVLAVQAEGRTRLAAVVPSNLFGEALASGMAAAAAEASLPPPRVERYSNSFANLTASLKTVSDYASRRGAIEARQRAARADPADPNAPPAPAAIPDAPPPPPIDALLLGASGPQLGQAAPLLTFYDIGPGQVRILGPATWAREGAQLGGLSGAWYAAPDPAQRAAYEQQYAAKYGAPPRDLTDLAYDAAGVARAVADNIGFAGPALTRGQGFTGADGLFSLLPDGQVRRGLAIFEIDKGGSRIVQPAPASMAAPGS